LGDKYSEVKMRRTTAGVNCFRIQQPSNDENDGDGGNNDDNVKKHDDDGDERESKRHKTDKSKPWSADATHAEISKDNRMLRSNADKNKNKNKNHNTEEDDDIVKERSFDIRVEKPICTMRKDTQLVLIDIPGMNEADSSKKYKEYVESKWETFDCVVLVMDAIQGVNTQEQVELLQFVKDNNTKLKQIPTIILGNKVDDPEDFDNHALVNETREKATEIFGLACSKELLKELLDIAKNFEYDTHNTKKAVFIPISAMNAFIYRKASNLTLDSFHEFDRDVMEKIGRDEVGRKWKKMTTEEKVNVIREAISDPNEYKERLAGTNFDNFLTILTYFIGGHSAQHDLLNSQIDVALKMMMTTENNPSSSSSSSSIAKSIHDILKKSISIGRASNIDLKDTFWRVYKQCEDDTFEKVENEIEPKFLERPMMELEKYHRLAITLKWDDELKIVLKRMQDLLRRLLTLIIRKKRTWSMSEFFQECHDNDNWKKPDKIQWENLSPHDWITILFSIVLASKNIEFSQSFGRELSSIEELLLHLRLHYEPKVFLIDDEYPYEITSDKQDSYIFAYRKMDVDANINIKKAIVKLEMPEDLSNPCHWGHIAWKCVRFSRSTFQHT
jgi:hypothetical protein